MPSLLVSDVVTRAQDVLSDTSAARWAVAELIRWVNDGQREIAIAQPEATAKIVNVTLAAGTKQTLPAGAIQLTRIIRNMGVGGATPGVAPRVVTMFLMDLFNPAWHSDASALSVVNYMKDVRTPRQFYVYPPMSGATIVECEYSVIPAAVAALGDTLTVDDFYLNPLVDYVCFRAFSKDIELPGMQTKAAAHKSLFDASLGATEQGEGKMA